MLGTIMDMETVCLFFLEHEGELHSIVLIEDGVIQRLKKTQTDTLTPHKQKRGLVAKIKKQILCQRPTRPHTTPLRWTHTKYL